MSDTTRDRLALAVATGQAVSDAAGALGISARSAYRMSGAEAFQSRVDELRRRMIDDAVGRRAGAATEATDTLRSRLGAPIDGRAGTLPTMFSRSSRPV